MAETSPVNDISPRGLWGELREVLQLSFPIMVTMISQMLMQFVDTLLVGHFGRAELAAAIPAGLTFFVVGAFMIGLVSCNNTFVSQCLGRGDPSEGPRYTAHAVYIGLVAQLLMVPLIVAAPAVFRLYNHPPVVQALEVSYFRVLSFRVGAMSAVAALASYFQATYRPIIPMITGICANVLNLILDLLLIFGNLGFPRWGLFGAGVATSCASHAEACLLLLLFLSRKEDARFLTRRWLPFESTKVAQLLRIGIAAGLSSALDLGSWAIFIGGAVGRLGENALAASNAAAQYMSLSFMPALGLNIGVTALVGQYIGRGDYPAAKRRAWVAMGCAASYMTLMGALFYILRRPLIEVFSSDPGVVAAGSVILTYVPLFQFADALGIVSAGALKGAGDTRFPALAQIIIAWFFFLPLVFYMSRPDVGGLAGAWTAATIYIWLYDIVLLWRFLSERWRKINIFS